VSSPCVVEFRGQQAKIDFHWVFPYPWPRWLEDIEVEWNFSEIGMEKSELNVTPEEDLAIKSACMEHAYDQSLTNAW
jgi:hypothetical protein